MRSQIDFSPLFRTSVGFDRLVNMIETASSNTTAAGYPPYNIESIDENHYRITLAIAGFAENDLDITSHSNTLIVKGNKEKPETAKSFLYQGIAERGFERRFQLADHVKVQAANLENGLLHVDLEREVPEELKPRKISIGSSKESLLQAAEKKLIDA
ncbi:heat-shock protein [Alginatibacterium sediminis]|uniref:Heat-shock protein n=1 Tax=Alginatibacterium sediminis TaxID=2164068 RepID=A0A420ENI0_9ALTE|nr:Hsp20 family protein [Alginatibacterium sediminis]RKF22262.1 heat-shock protein [Alginatibacterium sediminis]